MVIDWGIMKGIMGTVLFFAIPLTLVKACTHINGVPEHFDVIEQEMKNLDHPSSNSNMRQDSSSIRLRDAHLAIRYETEDDFLAIRRFYDLAMQRKKWVKSSSKPVADIDGYTVIYWCKPSEDLVVKVKVQENELLKERNTLVLVYMQWNHYTKIKAGSCPF